MVRKLWKHERAALPGTFSQQRQHESCLSFEWQHFIETIVPDDFFPTFILTIYLLLWCFHTHHSYSNQSFLNAITCNRRPWKLVTYNSFNPKHSFISFMLCRKTYCKRTRHKSYTQENGDITAIWNFGSRELVLPMAYQRSRPLDNSISTLTSTHGKRDYSMAAWTKTLPEDSSPMKMYGWDFRVRSDGWSRVKVLQVQCRTSGFSFALNYTLCTIFG